MRHVSPEVSELILHDPFYTKCCLCGWPKVQWHHNLIFGGRQVDAAFAILPVCPKCHETADQKEVKAKLDWIMLNRATDEELEYYSKVRNLKAERLYLNQIYGTFPAKENS